LRIELFEACNLPRRHAAREMRDGEVGRMIETSGGGQFGQSHQRRAIVRDVERAHPVRVLRCDAGGAAVVVAGLRLDAAER